MCIRDRIYAYFFGLACGWIILLSGIQGLGGWGAFMEKAWPDVRFVTFRGSYVPGVPNWIPGVFGMVLLYMGYSIINQEYVKKILSAANEHQARLGSMFPNIPLWIIWILPASLIGIVGRQLYPPGTFTGPADQVLAFIIRDFLPAGLTGLVVAGFIAGSQDIGGTAQTVASLLTIDFYQRYIKPDATESHYLKVGRMLTALIMIIPILWIPLMISFPFTTWLYALVTGALVTPTMWPYILGPVVKRLSRWSAFIGCLAGGIYGIIIRLLERFGPPLPAWVTNPWMAIFPTCLITVVTMFIVSAIENSIKGPIPEDELEGAVVTLGKAKTMNIPLQEILTMRATKAMKVSSLMEVL